MCLMKVIERKRKKKKTGRWPSHRGSGSGGPNRSHFKHNSEIILTESLKEHHVCWVENVWKGGEESRHGFAGVHMRRNQVGGTGMERSQFNK